MLQSGCAAEKLANDRDALFGSGKIIQTEFEKGLSRIDFAARVFEQFLRVGKTHGDADPR